MYILDQYFEFFQQGLPHISNYVYLLDVQVCEAVPE